MSTAAMEGVIQDIERFLEMVKVGLKTRATPSIIYCIPPVLLDLIAVSTEELAIKKPENLIVAYRIISKVLDGIKKELIAKCDEMEALRNDKSKNPYYN